MMMMIIEMIMVIITDNDDDDEEEEDNRYDDDDDEDSDNDKIPAYCGVIVTFKNSFSIVHTSISSILRSQVHRSVYTRIYIQHVKICIIEWWKTDELCQSFCNKECMYDYIRH